jgi:hypothetical protein
MYTVHIVIYNILNVKYKLHYLAKAKRKNDDNGGNQTILSITEISLIGEGVRG